MGRQARLLLALAAMCILSAVGAGQALADYNLAGSFAGGGPGLGGSGTGVGYLSNPGKADVNAQSGKLYVADTGNNRVQVFSETKLAAEYDSHLAVASPRSIAIDQDTGELYVATASGVSKYTEALVAAGGWTDPNVTGALAVDPSSGDLLVADTNAGLIRRFESDGTADGTFSAPRPIDVAANTSGQIFVVTTTGDIYGSCGPTSSLVRYSAAGASIETVGGLTVPGSVAVDLDSDSIVASSHVNEYPCEQGNTPKVQFFDATGTHLQTISLPSGTMYAAVPAVATRGDGSSRVYAITKSPMNDEWGETRVFAMQEPVAPDATLGAHENVGPFSVTLNGTVNPVGEPTTCRFEYSVDNSFDKSTPCASDPGGGTDPVAVHAAVTELITDTTYNYRLVASKGPLSTATAPSTFTTTHADLAEVELHEPTVDEFFRLTLKATINPLGNPASYLFKYRKAGSGEWQGFPFISNVSGSSPLDREAKEAIPLEPNTAYEVRVLVTNGVGPVEKILNYTTPAPPPAIRSASASAIGTTTASLAAMINPFKSETTYQFEYGATTSYGNVVPAAPAVLGDGNEVLLAARELSNLSPGQTYYFRVIAASEAGTSTFNGSFETLAEACPNTTIRTAQGATHLDDCRAYEQVTPARKFGYGIGNNFGWPHITLVSSPDGETVSYAGFNPLDGATAGSMGAFRSQRTESGWANKGVLPTPGFGQVGGGLPGLDSLLRGSNPGQTVFAVWDFSQGPYGWLTVRRADGSFVKLAPATVWATPNGMTPGQPWYQGMSDDGKHVVFTLNSSLIPGLAGNGDEEILYEWVDDGSDSGKGTIRVVNRTNDPKLTLLGTEAATLGGGGVTTIKAIQAGSGLRNAISADGSRIYFQTPAPSSGTKPGGPLYLREDGAVTTEISRPAEGHTPTKAPTKFRWLDASHSDEDAGVDGRYAFFWADGDLVPGAGTSGGIYRYDAEGDDLILIDSAGPIDVGQITPTALVSPDGAYVYYTKGFGVHVYHDGSISTIHPNVAIGDNGPVGEAFRELTASAVCKSADVSGDGSGFVFSGTPDGSSFSQVFLYDADADELVEVSPLGVDAGFGRACQALTPRIDSAHVVSADGNRVYFETAGSLVARDINGVQDVYEWHDGRLSLISSGVGPSHAHLFATDETGENVFFVSEEQLTSSDGDTAYDVFVARAGGGFADRVVPTCEGEGCRGPASQPPAQSSPGTASFTGAPNAKPKRKKAKKKAAKKKAAKKKAAKKKAAKKSKRANNKRGASR